MSPSEATWRRIGRIGAAAGCASLLACSTPPSDLVPVAGSHRDSATGLPTRVEHRASGIVFVLIPNGELRMGSPAGEPERDDGEKLHRRAIRKPFYLGETEVTVGQFRRFVEATGYRTDAERGEPEGNQGQGAFAATPDGERAWSAAASWRNPFPNLGDYRIRDDHPVVQVSWNDARKFAAHYGFELPTEAQWEYAARAGGRERFPWGDAVAAGAGFANVQDEAARRRFPAWNGTFPFDDGAALLSPVGRYKPNAWGLRDMIGNVEEWVQDAYGKYPADEADERAAEGGAEAARVLRGGAWLDQPFLCRAAARAGLGPQWRRDFVGFRVALAAGS